jgi:hypothetical protein
VPSSGRVVNTAPFAPSIAVAVMLLIMPTSREKKPSYPYRKPSGWRVGANRAMLLSDVGLLQTDLAGACRAVAIETGARGGEPDVAPADQRPAADRAKKASDQQDRPIDIGRPLLAVPRCSGAVTILKPNTVIRWHRAGFRAYWRWKSRTRGGRPKVPPEIRQLIRDMSLANPLWGAPRIHGELLKLGIDVGQTSVAKYMARRRRPPSQGWTTFLRNHADGIVAMDLFVVPTISFRLLFGLLILRHVRRRILWLGGHRAPDRRTEACGWERAPEYLIHDRDRAYGEVFTRRVRAMGIRDRPTSPRSPWQNAYAERADRFDPARKR